MQFHGQGVMGLGRWSTLVVCIGSAFAGWVLSTSAAWAQAAGGLLPATGVGGRGQDLRSNLEGLLPNLPVRSIGRAWTISPSIGVDVGVTDNPGGSGRSSSVDAFTMISPTVALTGDTSRLTVRLNYAPEVYLYARTSGQNRVSQSLNASTLVTIVPETFFLDLRGLISEQSRTGSNQLVNQQNNQFLSRQDTIRSVSFSATPYLQHRFAGWGTGRIGYSIARTLQDSQDGLNTFNNGLNTFDTSPGFGTTGNLTTQRERASFVTGENLGRINNETILEAVQYSGSGAYHGAYRNTVSNELGYAVSRTITLLGGIGYQDLRFSGAPGYRLREPTWNVGTRLSPNADSTITVLYGRRDGSTQVSFDGSYSPTARTRIFGRYSTGISSDAEDQQSVLQTTSVGPTGLLVDSVTGAPVSATNSFGTQNGINRIKRLSFTALLLMDRDSFSATVTNEDRTTLTPSTSFLGNTVAPGTSSSSTTGSLGWQHDLNPVTSLSTTVSYGVSNNATLLGNAGGGSQNTFSASASLGHTFTETLTGSVRYSYTDRSGGQGNNLPATLGGNSTQNLLLVGLRKSF